MRGNSKITTLKEFPDKTTLLEMEMKVMEMIARDEPLAAVLDQVARNFEKNIEGALCSILLLDKSGVHVLHGAAPSIPHEYNMAINGLAIGDNRGSCGTAASRKERIVVSDIATDPLWADYKDLALKHGLKACWSTPILRNNGDVLGTFAIYYRCVKSPDEIDIELIDRSANQVKIAIEQHNRAAKLAESEEKYRSLAEGAPDVITRYDSEIRVTYANPSMFRLTGFKEEEVIGKTHSEMGFTKMDVIFWDENIKSVFKTGKPLHTQFDWHWANKTLHFDWQLCPEFDSNGNVKSVLGVSRDITALKKAEEEIKKRERFLAIVTESFPNSYLTVVGSDMKIIYTAGEAFAKSNFIPDEFIGKSVAETLSKFSKEATRRLVEAYQQTLKGEPQIFELDLDGQYFLYKTVPLKTELNQINSLLVVSEDITDKKAAEIALANSELLFTRLTDNAPVGIFQTDLAGNCTYVNSEWMNCAGISYDEAMADGWIRAVHPEDEGRILIEWQRALSEKKEFKSELRFITPQGKITWVAIRAVILYDSNHEPYGYIGMTLDITDQKNINELLEENERRYRTTLERITDGFVALDKNWCYTYMNKRAGEIFDRDPNTMIGKHIWTEFPEGIGQPFHRAYEKAMQTQEYISLEEYYPPYNSWFENHIYPSPEGLSIYFKDVTDRKKNEVKLFEAIESLETAEEQAMLGSWEFDIINDKRKWSKQMFRFFGYKPGPEAPPDEDIIKRIHPEDKVNCEKCFKNKKFTEEPNYFLFRTNPALLPLRYLLCQFDVEYDELGKPIKFRGTLQDITDRVIAEQKTKESEEKYRTLVDQAADAIFLVDLDGNYLEANEGAFALTGYSVEELKRMNGRDLVWEEDLKNMPLQTEKIKTGDVVFIERVLKRKDNSLINVEIHAKLMGSGKANVVIRDVTERFLARKKIRESEEKYRALVNQASDGIFIVNPSLQLEQVNKMACTMLGYSEEELLKLSLPDFVILQEKDPPIRIKELKEDVSILQERTLMRSDGTSFPVEVNATKLKNGNTLSIVRDITKRKNTEKALAESESRLRTILENEPECVKILNRRGELVDMNPAGLAMIQADGLHAVNGIDILNFVDVPYKKAFRELTQNVFKGIAGKLEFEIIGLKGRRLWMETHAVPFRDADGKIVSLLAVTRDITDRKSAEAKIAQYTSQLKELTQHLQHVREEERAALSRELHDELGQQLTAIKMDLSWLNKKINTEELRSKLQETIVLTLDAVSTVRRINSELRPSLLDNLGLFAALEHQINEFSKRYKVSCSFQVAIDEPKFDQHYNIAIFRIFQETLNNIAKHAEASEVKVEIKEEDGNFHLIIEDNGIGFNPNGESKARSFGILGMTERAMMMDGTLTVRSDPGKGTTLHLIVPTISLQ